MSIQPRKYIKGVGGRETSARGCWVGLRPSSPLAPPERAYALVCTDGHAYIVLCAHDVLRSTVCVLSSCLVRTAVDRTFFGPQTQWTREWQRAAAASRSPLAPVRARRTRALGPSEPSHGTRVLPARPASVPFTAHGRTACRPRAVVVCSCILGFALMPLLQRRISIVLRQLRPGQPRLVAIAWRPSEEVVFAFSWYLRQRGVVGARGSSVF